METGESHKEVDNHQHKPAMNDEVFNDVKPTYEELSRDTMCMCSEKLCWKFCDFDVEVGTYLSTRNTELSIKLLISTWT